MQNALRAGVSKRIYGSRFSRDCKENDFLLVSLASQGEPTGVG